MRDWLKLLLAFFLLAIPGEGEDTAAGGGDAGAGDAGDAGDGADAGDGNDAGEAGDGADAGEAGEGGDDGVVDGGQQARGRRIGPSQADVALAEENARLRAEAAELRQGRERQHQSEEERLRAAEEARLADPKTTPLEKWQIGANRELRTANQRAARAESNAADVSDRTSFQIACQQNKRLASVAKDVEAELQKLRQRGESAPREALAYFILGKKVASAPATKAKQPAVGHPGQQRAEGRDRGPAPRSDVRRNGRSSESEARRRRLENQVI